MSEPSTAAEPVRLHPRRPVSDMYFFGRGLYPASPLSWAAPLWYYGCGILAAGYMRSSQVAILPPLLGLVLVGPLLGSAWRGALAVNQRRLRMQFVPVHGLRQNQFSLPYVLPASPGDRLATILTRATNRWLGVRPLLGLPLLELAVGGGAAVIVAATLGAPTLLVTLAGLATALLTAAANRAVADHELLAVASPLLLCWMVALSLQGEFEALPMATGALLALGTASMSVVERTGRGLILQLVPQVLLILCVVLAGEQLAGLVLGLIAFAQVLWAPALSAAHSRSGYYKSLQVLWMAAVLVAALAGGAAK